MVTATLIFATPLWLAALPILAIAGYFFGRTSRRRAEQKIGLFVSAGLVKDAISPLASRPRRLRFIIPLAVAMLLIVAAARPLTGPRPDHADRKGVDFVVALDVSKSMWADDVAPNRLAAVKKELSEWLKTMSGDRMGLVLFAGDAIIQAPVTFDYQALNRVLQEASPKAISKGGTNIGQSIEMADTLLKKSGLDTRALVILTDGENLDGDAVAAARAAHEKDGLSIFTVGVGSAAGSKIPAVEPDPTKEQKGSRRSYLRNEYGTEIVSQLDERALRAVAAAGGGQYETFQPGQQFFPRFRDSHLLSLSKNQKILNVQDYYEWFQLPVALAILLLMLEPRLTLWRRTGIASGVGVPVVRPATSAQPAGALVRFGKKAGRPRIGVPIILFLALAQVGLSAEALRDEVQNLLKQKKANAAVALVKQQVEKEPENLLLLYNYGLTLYQAGHYEEAIAAFQDVEAAGTTDENLRAQATLQLGNAQFRLGSKLGGQPAAALSMERALSYYDQLLNQKPSADAKHNREATVQALQKILRAIANDRHKIANEQRQKNELSNLSKTLKEAVDALDRMVALDPSNKELAAEANKVHQRLADALLADAARLNEETDKMEAANDPKKDKQILDRRNQAIEIDKQALSHNPNDPRIPAAITEQQNKMADLLTKRAEEKVAPVLAKPEPNGKDLASLNSAHNDLAAALEIAPDHAKAKELKAQTDKRLEDLLLQKAETALRAAEANNNPRAQLGSAMAASETFQKAQEINPDSQRAKAGLEKLQTLLPKAHADVAALDLAEGKKLLGNSDPGTAKPDGLKKAIGSLETAAQNYGRAVALAPGEGDFQKGLAEAQQLLSESREALDKNRQTAAADSPPSDQPGEANGSQNAPGTQVYAPRPSPGPPSVTSGAFWNKNKRDW